MRTLALVGAAALVAAAACGGATKGGGGGGGPLGDTHATPPPNEDDPAARAEGGEGGGSAEAEIPPAPPPKTTVTLSLRNAASDELHFALDKGWSAVVFAYTGKPPKAKAAVLFATWCTESCDAAPEAQCPKCAQPDDPSEAKRAELQETRREVVPAGAAYALEWDGEIFAYEPVKQKRNCQCWRKVPPPADTYTIKACGLRPAKRVGQASKLVCTETQAQLPVPPGTTIELVFDK